MGPASGVTDGQVPPDGMGRASGFTRIAKEPLVPGMIRMAAGGISGIFEKSGDPTRRVAGPEDDARPPRGAAGW